MIDKYQWQQFSSCWGIQYHISVLMSDVILPDSCSTAMCNKVIKYGLLEEKFNLFCHTSTFIFDIVGGHNKIRGIILVTPVGRGYRIHQLHLCRGIRLSNECPRYDIKQSDCEALEMEELWRMRSTSLLPLLPGPLWPGVVASFLDKDLLLLQ